MNKQSFSDQDQDQDQFVRTIRLLERNVPISLFQKNCNLRHKKPFRIKLSQEFFALRQNS